MKKLISILGAVTLALGITAISATAASAHVPDINVTCQGVVLHAYAYDGNKANTWTVSIDGQVQSGTFGASLDKTIPVPQEGKTSTIGAQIADADQTPAYSKAFSGPVGPCGTVPPPMDVCSNIDGAQATIPDGLIQDGTSCVTPPPVLIDVAIVPPTETPATCDAPANYTLYEQPTGVKYALTDINDATSRPVAGTFTLADGTSLTVNAHSIAGYTPVSGTWTFTGHAKLASQSTDANAPCYVAPPVVTPPTESVPTAPTAAVTPAQPELLAHTGVDDMIPLGIAISILALGVVLLGVRRRRMS